MQLTDKERDALRDAVARYGGETLHTWSFTHGPDPQTTVSMSALSALLDCAERELARTPEPPTADDKDPATGMTTREWFLVSVANLYDELTRKPAVELKPKAISEIPPDVLALLNTRLECELRLMRVNSMTSPSYTESYDAGWKAALRLLKEFLAMRGAGVSAARSVKVKVYGWHSMRQACTGGGQTREIVAAKSKAEAARCAGVRYPHELFNLTETGNSKEIETALSRPGVVFWRPVDDYRGPWTPDDAAKGAL